MKTKAFYPLILFLIFIQSGFAQCPTSAASLGLGNGLQLCWPRGQAPASLSQITYDGILYAGRFVNGGQGDCWRTTTPATLGVNGNHVLQIIIGGIPVATCMVQDGQVTGILPIELANFDVFVEDKQVFVHWQTASEENNSHFLIERSQDAVNYETIGKVDGAGNSNQAQFYEFIDNPARYHSGVFYYRLTQVDFDGKSTTYAVKAIELKATAKLEISRIFPNPATDQVTVLYNAQFNEKTTISILNQTGQIVFEESILPNQDGLQEAHIQIADLQAGYYFVRIQTASEATTSKLIKS